MTPLEAVLAVAVLFLALTLAAGWFVSLWALTLVCKSFNARPPTSLNVLLNTDGTYRQAGPRSEEEDTDPCRHHPGCEDECDDEDPEEDDDLDRL